MKSDQTFWFGLLKGYNACSQFKFSEQLSRATYLQTKQLALALPEVNIAR